MLEYQILIRWKALSQKLIYFLKILRLIYRQFLEGNLEIWSSLEDNGKVLLLQEDFTEMPLCWFLMNQQQQLIQLKKIIIIHFSDKNLKIKQRF